MMADKNIAEKEDIAQLKKRIDDQQSKIDSIWNLVSDKKRVEQIVGENDMLRKQVAEKDSMLKVIKDRLTEKTTQLNTLEKKNSQFLEELEKYKKQVFEFNNKIGAIEKRVYSTDEQNQKLLYELMKYKERLKELETELGEKDQLVELQSDQLSKKLEAARKEAEDQKLIIMKNHTKKIAVLQAAIGTLKTKIEQQNRLVNEKLRKESALISEFNSKMGDLLAAGSGSMDLSGIDTSLEDVKGSPEKIEEEIRVPGPAADNSYPEFSLAEHGKRYHDEEDLRPRPSRTDEIVPMIELAMDHGDEIDTVQHSLKSSGYTDKEIEDAFSKVNLAKNQ